MAGQFAKSGNVARNGNEIGKSFSEIVLTKTTQHDAACSYEVHEEKIAGMRSR